MIYFDNGASTHPKPPSVIRAVSSWIRKNGSNPGRSGHHLSMEAAEMIYKTRSAYAKLFGMEKVENVVLVPNATYALNIAILGLFNKGDHIITTDLEHNSVLRPLFHLTEGGVEVTVVPIDFNNDDQTVTRILSSINKNTKAVVCTQCSNISGFALPIEKIGNRIPEDVLLIVDGAQGAGSLPIDIKKCNVDYYCAPSHKSLMGPQGGGVLLINNRIPRPLVFGGTGTDSLLLEQPKKLPESLESGTLPAAVSAGMLAAAEFIEAVGIDKIYRHKQHIMEYAYNELKNLKNIELYMEPYRNKCHGVIPFNVKNRHSSQVGEELDQNGICVRSGIHCAPLFHRRMGTEKRGMVRLSFGYFNTTKEIDHMIRVLKKMI